MNFLFLLKNQKVLYSILGILLFGQVMLNYNLHKDKILLKDQLSQVTKDLRKVTAEKDLILQKFKLQEEAINNLKEESTKKEIELSRVNAKLLQNQAQANNKSMLKWEQTKFIDVCEKDVEHLRNHAIQIKGKWK